MTYTEPNQALRNTVNGSMAFGKDAVTVASFSHSGLILAVLGLIIIRVGITGPA
jgi:hypothetical protein